MFRPHLDVLTGEQAAKIAGRASQIDMGAGNPSSPLLPHLLVHRGTKGGRPRLFPIDTPERQAVIEQARQLVRTEGASISDPALSLVQAMRRLRYCMERFGITRADLLRVADRFRVPSAKASLDAVREAVRDWPRFGREAGLPADEIRRVGEDLNPL